MQRNTRIVIKLVKVPYERIQKTFHLKLTTDRSYYVWDFDENKLICTVSNAYFNGAALSFPKIRVPKLRSCQVLGKAQQMSHFLTASKKLLVS